MSIFEKQCLAKTNTFVKSFQSFSQSFDVGVVRQLVIQNFPIQFLPLPLHFSPAKQSTMATPLYMSNEQNLKTVFARCYGRYWANVLAFVQDANFSKTVEMHHIYFHKRRGILLGD